MNTYTTISGRKISVSENKSQRTFTIRVECGKYRTIKMDKEEFRSCQNNTGNDWAYFLKGQDYYKI